MMSFESMSDEQLAKHIHAAVSELKARHAKQQKELAAQQSQQLSDALAQNKRGPKPKGKASGIAA